MTDYRISTQWVYPNVDLYLVAHPRMKDDLIERGIDGSHIAVTGIPIHPSFSKAIAATPAEFGLRPGVPVVLIMSSGYRVRTVLSMVQACMRLPLSMQIVAHCGRDQQLKAKLDAIAARNERIVTLGYVERMDILLSAVDVLVSKAGGITMTEALAKELPVIIYQPIPGQEQENTEFLVREGAAIVAYDAHALASAVRHMVADPTLRSNMRDSERRLSHPNSAEAAAKQILSRFSAWRSDSKSA